MIFCALCHYVFYDCSGGIALTVQGESLESVAVHVMVITMVYKKRNPTSGQFETIREEKFTSVSTCSFIFSQNIQSEEKLTLCTNTPLLSTTMCVLPGCI